MYPFSISPSSSPSPPPYLKRETADQIEAEVEAGPLPRLSQEIEGSADLVTAGERGGWIVEGGGEDDGEVKGEGKEG